MLASLVVGCQTSSCRVGALQLGFLILLAKARAALLWGSAEEPLRPPRVRVRKSSRLGWQLPPGRALVASPK